jgi:hypothetical protein
MHLQMQMKMQVLLLSARLASAELGNNAEGRRLVDLDARRPEP